MYFNRKATAEDINYLLQNNISENKKLEYKRQLPEKNDDKGKTKILQSITAFVNTDGGTIIFGIAEKGDGTYEINIIETLEDDYKLQWDEIIKNRILPRINPPTLYALNIDGKNIFVMDINPSYTKPHFVNGDYVFYGRNNASKFQLDISDIKKLFLQSITVEEQFENFKLQRVMKLKSENFPFQFDSKNIVTLHIASIASLVGEIQLSKNNNMNYDFLPIQNTGLSTVNNYDGFLNYTYSREKKMYSYVQIFRNGIIEASTFGMYGYPEDKKFYGIQFEQEYKQTIIGYINSLKKYNIDFPYFISISLLNMKGYKIVINNSNYRDIHNDFYAIYEDDLLLPTIFIENEYDINDKLKYCFDVFWNANGYKENPIK